MNTPPHLGPSFFHFHAVVGKIDQNNGLAPPPLQLAPLPLGNPGFVTEVSLVLGHIPQARNARTLVSLNLNQL